MKGVGPRVLRSSPQYGVMLLAYELLLRLSSKEHVDDTHKGRKETAAVFDSALGARLTDPWFTMHKWGKFSK
jgi:hypothetical protein